MLISIDYAASILSLVKYFMGVVFIFLLNSHYETNYNNFINSHRVEEAGFVLNEKSDMNMLKTAFDCGFNSKSTFNVAFRKFTDLSPSEYKKQIIS